MKKTLRAAALLLSLLLAVSTLAFTAVTAEGEDTITIPYGQLNKGFVDKHNVGEITKDFQIDGKTVLKIVPLPDAEPSSLMLLEAWGINNTIKVDIREYKYATLEYKYVSKEPASKKAQIAIMRNGGIMTSSPTVDADNVTKVGEWDTWYFNFGKATDPVIAPDGDGILRQFHMRPFGSTASGTLSAADELYIGNLTFYKTNPNPNAKATVQYEKGDPGATGSGWADSYAIGEKYTLPECPFTLELASFLGWEDSKGVVHQPGEEMTANDDVSYIAAWKKDPENDGRNYLEDSVAAAEKMKADIAKYVTVL